MVTGLYALRYTPIHVQNSSLTLDNGAVLHLMSLAYYIYTLYLQVYNTHVLIRFILYCVQLRHTTFSLAKYVFLQD
jgi:hypothetical protein